MTGETTDATELRAGLNQVRSARAATLALVAGIDDRQAARAPKDAGWSAAQVLDHLLRTDEVYRLEIGRLFELRAKGLAPVVEIGLRDLNTRPIGVPDAVLPYLDTPFRLLNRLVPAALREYLTGVVILPFRTPDRADPDPEGGIEGLRLRLRASGEATEKLLSGRDVSGMILDHPLLGRNKIPALIRILARHEDRHRGQISRVLAEQPEPPGRAGASTSAAAPAASTTTGGPAASTTAGGHAPGAAAAGHAGAGRRTVPVPDGPAGKPLRVLAQNAAAALPVARQMLAWWKAKALEDALKLFPLRPARPDSEIDGFFDSMLFMGQMLPTPIMGCLQRHRFKRCRPPVERATRHLETFVDERFLELCEQRRPDGTAGGFRYRPLCFEDRAEQLLAPADGHRLGTDLAAFRDGLEWGTLQVDILDFVRANASLAPYDKTLSRFIKESAYIVVHQDLALETRKAPKGVMAERRFGYAFLDQQVEPNLFGFGPGKFGVAIKQWRFLLFLNGDVEIQIAFLVQRSKKVMDVAGFDPVYASVGLADAFSFGAFGLRASAHDALDQVFLKHHGEVHAAAVHGLQDVWEGQRWVPAFSAW